MSTNEKKKNMEYNYDEKGTEEVAAQVMDAYNDGAIDAIVTKDNVAKD